MSSLWSKQESLIYFEGQFNHRHVFCSKMFFTKSENEVSSAITKMLPLECIRRQLSFEWSHLWVSPDRAVSIWKSSGLAVRKR